MGLISRITTFIAGNLAKASEVNSEFDNILTEFNGNIDNSNVDPNAAIAESKINNISASDAAARADSAPGNSGSPANSGSLESEVQRLRYTQRQSSVGSSASWFDSGGTEFACGWQELPIRGRNLLLNPSFERYTAGSGTPPTAAPDDWEFVGGTPTTATIQATAVTEGTGDDLRIVTSGATQGVEQTIRNVKEGGYYLVGARVKQSTGTVRIRVGDDVVVAADYRSNDLDSTSPVYETKAMVVKVDTGIAIGITPQFLGVVNLDDIRIDHAFCYELNTDPIGDDVLGVADASDSEFELFDTNTLILGGDPASQYMTNSVTVPAIGVYDIFVHAYLCASCAAPSDVLIQLTEDIDAAGTPAVVAGKQMVGSTTTNVMIYRIKEAVNGSTYEYEVEVDASGSGSNVALNGISGDEWESAIIVDMRRRI